MEIQKLIEKYDSKNVLASIQMFPKQYESGYNSGKTLQIPKKFGDINNIVVLGMGGSALPAHIVKGLRVIQKPLEIWSAYGLPTYVDKNTLIIAISYSGTTEETVSGAKAALERNAKVIGITTGGEIEMLLRKIKMPICLIDKEANPCGQPRFGVGYMLGALIGICENLYFTKKEFTGDRKYTYKLNQRFLLGIAKKIQSKIPLLVAGEHLGQSGHFFQNQINETGKTFGVYHELPELNHHLLEGLTFPSILPKKMVILLLESKKYDLRIKKRILISKEILKKQKISIISIPVNGIDILHEVLSVLYTSEYISYYLGLINKVDPSHIPWVTYLKKNL